MTTAQTARAEHLISRSGSKCRGGVNKTVKCRVSIAIHGIFISAFLGLPCVKGNSSQCEEMSRSDRGDRRRQRLSAVRLTEGLFADIINVLTYTTKIAVDLVVWYAQNF